MKEENMAWLGRWSVEEKRWTQVALHEKWDPPALEEGRLHADRDISPLWSSHCRCPYLKKASLSSIPWQPLSPAVCLKVILFFLEPPLRVCRWLVLISWSHPVDEANINA